MHRLLLVALGGALGAVLRYGAYVLVARFWEGEFPIGTWAVNLVGCLLIGLLVPVLGRGGLGEDLQFLLVVGFLGAFTTFSTYSLETLTLWEEGLGAAALLNAAGSLILGLLFVWIGLKLGRAVV